MSRPGLHPKSPRVWAGAAGLVGLLAVVLGLLFDPRALMHAYYAGLMGWALIPLGALGWLASWHVITGGWGIALAPALAAAVRTLPLIGLLYVPALIWPQLVFPWVGHIHDLGATKAQWFSSGFFVVRMAVYFVVWILLALFFLSPAGEGFRNKRAGAAGMILYFLTGSFAGIDWVMSLDPHFSSSVFGMLSLADQMLAGLSWAVLVTLVIAPGDVAESNGRIGALGSTLWGTLMTWAYLEFMQYLVIWSNDLPDKTHYYLLRSAGPWGAVLWVLAIFHAALPLIALLPRFVRNSRVWLAAVAGLLVVTSLLKMIWRTAPLLNQDGYVMALLVLAMVLGIGGVWTLAFLRSLERIGSASQEIGRALEGAHGR